MDQTQQALGYLRQDPLRHIEMLESLGRGQGELVACRPDGVLLRNRGEQLYLLAADSVSAAQALCQGVAAMDLAVAHSQETAAFLGELYRLPCCQPCAQAAYLGKGPLPVGGGFAIEPLGTESLEAVAAHYHASREYLQNRLAAGAMLGAFQETGELMGFIGMHAEGSVGMLEVLPAFRRRGVATALMNSMANWCLERGFVPFSQIWMDNQASFALHRSLGWSLSPQPLYWVTQD